MRHIVSTEVSCPATVLVVGVAVGVAPVCEPAAGDHHVTVTRGRGRHYQHVRRGQYQQPQPLDRT